MKWICTVCKYVHEGDAPPDVCPVCGAPKEVFEKVTDENDTTSATAASQSRTSDTETNGKSRKWICTVCNYVHDGEGPPDSCPVCKKPWSAFIPYEKDPDGLRLPPAKPKEPPLTADILEKSPRKWLCTVCGYIHEGDAPPDACPLCKKSWSAFIPNVEGPDGPRLPVPDTAAPPKTTAPKETAPPPQNGKKGNRWRCVICNYIHEGSEPTDVCPICGAGADAFVPEMDSPEHHHRGFSGLIEKLHLHPVAAHFPNGALPLSFLAWIIYLIVGDGCLERSSFYLMLVATAAVPFTGFSGWSDAKHRFGTTTTGVFPEKKLWSWVLTGVSFGMAGWRLSIGWFHAPVGIEVAIFTVLLIVATAISARLGMLGGKLVFGH